VWRIPAESSVANVFAATPGWLFIPAPTRLTFPRSSREVYSTPSAARVASAFVAVQSITPRCCCSLPRKMFSAIDRNGLRASSWLMITIPRSSLSRILRNSHGSPSKRMSPS